MNRYFILSFCILFLFVSRQVSASSGVTYCENDLATKCQDSCSFKKCVMGSCRSSINSDSATCVCGMCYGGLGQPNGPFVMNENTGNLSS
ncbi:hypothetical protein CRE_02801 [Caenorhabditis remanei]|uniref:Uncharacterized protein n=1 Tax=Caenorhabditis remanei TaxID=31234 RepID=E3LX10_CAERE|nr:hypothetical protein CRE_02801 [Caenorhabditis remanei]